MRCRFRWLWAWLIPVEAVSNAWIQEHRYSRAGDDRQFK